LLSDFPKLFGPSLQRKLLVHRFGRLSSDFELGVIVICPVEICNILGNFHVHQFLPLKFILLHLYSRKKRCPLHQLGGLVRVLLLDILTELLNSLPWPHDSSDLVSEHDLRLLVSEIIVVTGRFVGLVSYFGVLRFGCTIACEVDGEEGTRFTARCADLEDVVFGEGHVAQIQVQQTFVVSDKRGDAGTRRWKWLPVFILCLLGLNRSGCHVLKADLLQGLAGPKLRDKTSEVPWSYLIPRQVKSMESELLGDGLAEKSGALLLNLEVLELEDRYLRRAIQGFEEPLGHGHVHFRRG
jgi:hypothetical protein